MIKSGNAMSAWLTANVINDGMISTFHPLESEDFQKGRKNLAIKIVELLANGGTFPADSNELRNLPQDILNEIRKC